MTYLLPDCESVSPSGQSFRTPYGYVLTPNKEILMNQSPQINELATALAKCQGELKPALKDSNNPFHKSKYADLNSVWSVCREPLSRHGLAVIQTICKDEKGDLEIVTTLAHSSGQWIRSVSPIPIKEEVGKIDPNKKTFKNDPQALGSSITYMRRYCLSAIVGISTDEDDDGEKAMNRSSKEDKSPKKETPKVEGQPLTTDQTKELHDLADLCDPEYIGKLFSYLESQGIKGFDKLMSNNFNKVITGMRSNAESYQKGK